MADHAGNRQVRATLECQYRRPGVMAEEAAYPQQRESVSELQVVLECADSRARVAPAQRDNQPVPGRRAHVAAGVQMAAPLEAAHRGRGPRAVDAVRPQLVEAL